MLGDWLKGPPDLGDSAGGKGRRGKGAAADKGKDQPPDNQALVKLLRAYEKQTGTSMSDVVAFAEKPPEEESQPVDLSTKSLQDLLGRETRKKKQVEAS